MQQFLTQFAIGAALVSTPATALPTGGSNDGLFVIVAPEAGPLIVMKGSSSDSAGASKQAGPTNLTKTSAIFGRSQAPAHLVEGWLQAAFLRLGILREQLSVEVGEDFQTIAKLALRDAESVLQKLAGAGLTIRPSIGWDSDGSVSFFLANGDFSADFSVFGDGMISFSAKKGSSAALLLEAEVGGPLPRGLVEMFS